MDQPDEAECRKRGGHSTESRRLTGGTPAGSRHRQQDRELQELGIELIHGRRIPNYYFRRVMREAGLISPDEPRPNPRSWVTEDRRLKLTSREEKLEALIVFKTITDQLRTHPQQETHLQARIRAKRELEELQRAADAAVNDSVAAGHNGEDPTGTAGIPGHRGHVHDAMPVGDPDETGNHGLDGNTRRTSAKRGASHAVQHQRRGDTAPETPGPGGGTSAGPNGKTLH